MRAILFGMAVMATAALCFAAAIAAETPPPIVKAFHPAGPLAAYDVATIKPVEPGELYAGTILRRYIAEAYGVPMGWGMPGSEPSATQVIGGPDWIDKDRYEIKGRPADEVRVALPKMPREERTAQNRMMEQSLLAERFHLKVHFEEREMPIFELVPAKGGLKIKPVDPPAPSAGAPAALKPGELPRPGNSQMSIMQNGLHIFQASATTMENFCNALRSSAPEIGGRPIVNMTGFTSNFDVRDFRFAGTPFQPSGANAATASDGDANALSVKEALEQQFGLKLVAAKGQVEVVVIDSVDRPTEN